MNLNAEKLLPRAAELLPKVCKAVGKTLPWRNNFFSLLARSLETVHALELAADLLGSYVPPVRSRVPIVPRAGIGGHGTEAPRGICWHEYRSDADGTIVSARIIPPTSQNYATIEADLRALAPQIAELSGRGRGLALRAPDPQLRPVHQLFGAFPQVLADASRPALSRRKPIRRSRWASFRDGLPPLVRTLRACYIKGVAMIRFLDGR